jgi:hypothetical protein
VSIIRSGKHEIITRGKDGSRVLFIQPDVRAARATMQCDVGTGVGDMQSRAIGVDVPILTAAR